MSTDEIQELIEIGEKVKNLRLLLDLDALQLARFLKMDEKTLKGIEDGVGYHIFSLNKVSKFYKMSISELTDVNSTLPDKNIFKEEIFKYHLERNIDIQSELDQPPTLAYVIEVILVNSGFFNSAKSTKEVREYVQQNFEHLRHIKGISQALLNAKKDGILKSEKKNIANSESKGVKNNLYYIDQTDRRATPHSK